MSGDARRRAALGRALRERALAAGVAVAVLDSVLATPGDRALLHLLLGGGVEDAHWRGLLQREGLGYSVLHGDATQQTTAAWALLAPLAGLPLAGTDAAPERSAAAWRCEKCSDPECEHRLFRDLLAGRDASS
ncbi:hypothetical protein [Variovorax sp.]|uniref:hypothetical protein n=1 Tax=Variovorax sp. TaxID=1871043 RepID=UPI002D42B523|nr:hypothetical protein [Variovorax sp.]HYP84030.1 hypothetical protein [Variovorax sp.]